jgi:hypothetical protein
VPHKRPVGIALERPQRGPISIRCTLPIERRGGRDGGGSRTPVRPVGRSKRPWNKGLLIGQTKPLEAKHVWSIRVRFDIAGIIRSRLVSCSSARGILRGHGANLHEEQWHARQVLWCRRSSMRRLVPTSAHTPARHSRLPSNAVNSQQEAVLGWRPLFRLEPTYADRMSHLQKITFVVMREMGAHDVLIYCRDHRCSHHVETTADGWGDDVRLHCQKPSRMQQTG